MVFVIFFLLVSVTHVSSHEVCPKCGNMDVSYPLSTNDNCGNPNYRVHCNNSILEFLSATGFYYKIHNINPWAYKLIVSPSLILKNMCQSSNLTFGLSLDENSPFNTSTHKIFKLLNCSKNILLSRLHCSSNSLCRQFKEKVAEGSGCRNILCCIFLKDALMTSHRIRVRVGRCTAYTYVVDIKPGDSDELWNYGVELQWLPLN